jgi:hypothetical protein
MKNEEKNSIFSKLADSNPNTWPSLWRNQSESSLEVSLEKELEILNFIRASNEGNTLPINQDEKSIFANRTLQFIFAAAIVLFGIIISFYLPAKMQKPTLKIIKTEGKAFLVRNEKKILIEAESELELDDKILIADSSSLTFALQNKEEQYFNISSSKDTEFDLSKFEPENQKLNLELQKGIISVFSDKDMKTSDITVSYKSTTLHMTGKKALVEKIGEQLSLNRTEGKIKIIPSNQEKDISSDQNLALHTEKANSRSFNPNQQKEELPPSNESILDTLKSKNKQDLENIKSSKAEKIFSSLAEIKKEFGQLKEITLQDGTKLKGYLEQGADKCKMILVGKTIELKKSEIRNINDIKE